MRLHVEDSDCQRRHEGGKRQDDLTSASFFGITQVGGTAVQCLTGHITITNYTTRTYSSLNLVIRNNPRHHAFVAGHLWGGVIRIQTTVRVRNAHSVYARVAVDRGSIDQANGKQSNKYDKFANIHCSRLSSESIDRETLPLECAGVS